MLGRSLGTALRPAGFRALPIMRPHLARPLGLRHKSASATAASVAGRAVAGVRRGASFGFYSAVVLCGIGVIGVTGYYLTQELLLPSSDNQLFHKAFKLIERDETSTELLGTHLKAHGETTNQRNVKSRPIASRRGYDRFGREHVMMQFHIDGDKASGLARLEAIDTKGHIDFRYLVLEVPGHARHYLINNDEQIKPKGRSIFGIKWGPRNH